MGDADAALRRRQPLLCCRELRRRRFTPLLAASNRHPTRSRSQQPPSNPPAPRHSFACRQPTCLLCGLCEGDPGVESSVGAVPLLYSQPAPRH
ncbi:unnamed protein product [Linum trigynum]|uniref:Uncharacterized protein n=1 Tax=Linum trigynum TaxID=586398 RepID=A0AAV2ESW4_9ROSI